MRFVRFFLKAMFILLLFLLGISFADRELISQKVIGIELPVNTPDYVYRRIEELIVLADIENASQLCVVLNDYGLKDHTVVQNKYFVQTQVKGNVIPAGVYETVCLNDNAQNTNQRYLFATNQFALKNDSWLWRSYINFLSVLGYVEKIMNYL